MNEDNMSGKEKLKSFFKEWVIPFVIEILVVLLLVKYVFFFVRVPTASMVPTIMEHSYLFATRVHNPEKSLERGDVVVFYSDELQEKMVKRLIGLPNENVVVNENGEVFIDGEKLDEPYVKFKGFQTGEFDIPDDCYLFFGDNRGHSYDARLWENPYISGDDIIGEIHFTIYPFNKFGMIDKG